MSHFIRIALQNDQEFIQTMILQGRKKRKLEDEENIPQAKVRRITIKNEPEQVTNTSYLLVEQKAMNFILAMFESTTIDSLSTFFRTSDCHVFEFRLS